MAKGYLKNCIMIRKFTCSGWIMLLLLVIASGPLFAQDRQVTGTVTSIENSQPVEGATVTVKGTRIASTTNAQGRFTLTAPTSASHLVITHAGFASFEVPIGTGTDITAQIIPEIRALEDVVVIGYQTVRRKDLLASVSSVGAKD